MPLPELNPESLGVHMEAGACVHQEDILFIHDIRKDAREVVGIYSVLLFGVLRQINRVFILPVPGLLKPGDVFGHSCGNALDHFFLEQRGVGFNRDIGND